MPKDRSALRRIKEQLLKGVSAEERQNIEAVFEVGEEVLDSLGRITDAQERIAAALEAKPKG